MRMLARLVSLWLFAVSAAAAGPDPGSSPGQILRDQAMPAPALGRDLTVSLYLPPGYQPKGPRLPVIYLLHGVGAAAADWIDQGGVAATADRLILAGSLPPVLIVMPDAGTSWYVDSPSGGPGRIATAIWRDLPTAIEDRFRALDSRGGRAIAGYSMGGFGALRLAFAHPDRYVAAASLSGAFWLEVKPGFVVSAELDHRLDHIFNGSFGHPFDPVRFYGENPMTLAGTMAPGLPRPALYFTCGTDDRFRLCDEQRQFTARLDELGLDYKAEETRGDHDWDTWSKALPAVLLFLGRHFEYPG